jgi:hypothetical protein
LFRKEDEMVVSDGAFFFFAAPTETQGKSQGSAEENVQFAGH